MILGVGIDTIELRRISRAVEREGVSFLDEFLSDEERGNLPAGGPAREKDAALRVAAKEAFLKALGTGRVGRIGWHDVEIVGEPRRGATVRLNGEARRRSDARGVRRVHLAVSCTRLRAVASVVLEG